MIFCVTLGFAFNGARGPKIAFLLGWVFGFRALVAGAFRRLGTKKKVPQDVILIVRKHEIR